ncbi:piggyBac transposable element-derived protein 3-like, partial [Acyrthosiphon pisum]|uniref:PiggyBac transposable element-derived protein domain-containing protein n=1 Tax=Acyrthosiphon pisum TaxID=7029 RepID=A0A8R2BB66_ACYPI
NVHPCQPGPSNSPLAIPLDEIDEECDTNWEPTPKRKKKQSCSVKKSKQSNLKKTKPKPKKNTPVTTEHAPVTEDVTDEYHRIWRKKESKTDVPSYNNSESPVEDLFLDTSPTGVFLTLFEGILDHIVYQTNLYGTQKNLNLNIKPYEVLNFLGINFLMGYHRLPSWKHYWSCAPDLSVPFVAATMIRNHNNDKLYKLKPTETNQLSIDESMILFKGRSTLKQYNPMKFIKRGYKLWCLADQKGYIKKFQVYQGKDEQLENEFKDCGLGERIENSLACGTIRAHRKGIPIIHDDSKLARGSTDYKITDSGIEVFKWKDTKSVLLASNYHGTEKTTVLRKNKQGVSTEIPCPQIIKDYNNYMGVDHADQLRVTYGVDRRSKKWWHRLFWGMIDILFVNAYIIYKDLNGPMKLLEFRHIVVQGLINKKEQPTPVRGLFQRKPKENKGQINKRRGKNWSVPNDWERAGEGAGMFLMGARAPLAPVY